MNYWYNFLLFIAILIGSPFIILSLAHPKRRATMRHRLGLTINSQASKHSIGNRHPKGVKPIWIHALSVGEVLSAQPIVEAMAIRLPHRPLVFSASTMTGMAMAKRLFSGRAAMVFYFPYDIIFSVRKIISCIDPCLLVIVETDIWPNILYQVKKRSIPIVLTNGRLSRRSFRGYRLLGGFIRRVLTQIDILGVQSQQDALRFSQLGAPRKRIVVTGNVKFDQAEVDMATTRGNRLRAVIGFDPNAVIIVAGSTHNGEEDMLLDAHLKLKSDLNHLKLILVPRDPLRAKDLLKRCQDKGLAAGLLSHLDQTCPAAAKEVLIVNTIGILRDLYALADIAFIGGSLLPYGGHNPLEAAVYAKPIIFGPHMSDFQAVVEELFRSQAAVGVADHRQLTKELAELLADKDQRRAMGQRARQMLLDNKGATDFTVNLIATLVS